MKVERSSFCKRKKHKQTTRSSLQACFVVAHSADELVKLCPWSWAGHEAVLKTKATVFYLYGPT